MKSKLLILGLLLVILCSITSVGATDLDNNNTAEIKAADDELQMTPTSDDTLSAGSTFEYLQSQINNAKDGSVLTLDRDYADGSIQEVLLQIDKTLTIDGKGHTLDAKGSQKQVIISRSGEITLKNLIIKNGDSATFKTGAAVSVYNGAKLNVINCTFMDNHAYLYGGAIYAGARETALTVINSTFINNDGGGYGGAIYSKGPVTVQNSKFNGNKANEGGDIYTESTLDVINSNFNANGKTATNGGAISSVDEAYIENSTFTGYNANLKGGAIYASKNLLITRSKFTNNAAGQGGAVYTDGARTVIDFSTFISNRATSSDGGAVNANKYAHLGNSTFIANTAEGKGGAVYTTYIQFKDHVTFTNNSCKGHGGAVYTDTISNHVSNLYFEGNHADSDFGGALYINKKCEDIFISNSSFVNNHANAGDGGAIYSDSGSTRIHLNWCNFTNNYATGGKEKRYGGAIRAKDTLYVEDCIFIGNWAENHGGAIYTDLLGHIKNSYFEANHAKEDGGAVYVNNKCGITLANTYFKSNYCGRFGGAVYTDSKSTTMTITNNAFLSNKADREGHDVFNSGKYSSITSNWWGTNTPSFDNKLKEYHTFGSNSDRSDSNPLKMTLTGDAAGYANLIVDLQVKFSGDLPKYVFKNMTVASNKAGDFEGKLILNNQVKFNYIPDDGGTHTVSAKIDSQNVTYDIIVQKSSVYGKDLVKTYGDDNFFSAIFRDGNGNFLIEGSPVTFQVNNGEKYVKQVIGEGQALLEEVAEFLPGVYSIKSINKLTNEFFTNTVNVLPRNTTFNINDPFILKFNANSTKYQDNSTITFKAGDKTFLANTSDGFAVIRLNLTPGKYKLDAIYNNKTIYTINITIANAYSKSWASALGTTYGALLPIYENETYIEKQNVTYSRIGDNTYRYVLSTGEALIIYNVTVSNNEEFTNALRKISGANFKADVIIINLKPGTYKITEGFYKDQEWTYLIHLTHGELYINGNGATIDDEYHHNFMTIESSAKAVIENLNFKRFYRCFVNNGQLYVKNALFSENDASKWATKTPGSVIYNRKSATFENCTFDKNDNTRGSYSVDYYRKDLQAGVLYAEASSLTNFILCNFKTLYDSVHAVDGSMVVLYDKDAKNFNFLRAQRNNNFESGSCLEYRSYYSMNSNKTVTLSYNDFISFLKDINEEYYRQDASGYIVNIKTGDYTIKMKDVTRYDFRTARLLDYFDDTTQKENSFIQHEYLADLGSKPVVIDGHGAKLTLTDHDNNDDQHFAFVPRYGSLTLINLTLSGFNTAVVNYGTLILINCTLSNNVVHYIKQSGEGEYGGAIRNFGNFFAYNTTFANNRATEGAAYYSRGASALGQFTKCTFTGNTIISNLAWRTGDANTMKLDGNSVVKFTDCKGVSKSNIEVDGNGLFLFRDSNEMSTYDYTVDGLVSLYRLQSIINSQKYDIINVTFIKGTYGVFPDSQILFKPDYVELIFNGEGSKLFVENQKDNDDTQFIITTIRTSTFISNLSIQGFNIAIENHGGLTIFNSEFNANKVDYAHKDDYGGAIVNSGSLTIYNSTFKNGYAKYGGAIYNNRGTLVSHSVNYTNNKGYSSNSNVDIYNNEASAQVMTVGQYPKVVDHFPMAAWKQDLIETSIFIATTIISSGVSYGITAAGIAGAHFINLLVGATVGGLGGMINGLVYSVDHQNYATFGERLMAGIYDGISVVKIGEVRALDKAHKIKPIRDMTRAELNVKAFKILFDNLVKRNVNLILSQVKVATKDQLSRWAWHSNFDQWDTSA